MFEQAKDDLVVRQSTLQDCIQQCMVHPVYKPKYFFNIRKDYDRHGLDYIIEKYVLFGAGGIIRRKIHKKSISNKIFKRIIVMYERVISLGWFCGPALEMKRIGLRDGSYPFDWMLTHDFQRLYP